MQTHNINTKRARAWRKWHYGERKEINPYAEKKTRLEVLKERRKAWEQRNGKA